MSTPGGNWESLNWSVILHEMFLHAAEWGHKEAERLICQRCHGSASEPNLESDHSAMELVGYQTSCKEIHDIYHSVYLLRRPPGLPPCEDQQRRREICNVLSSLMSQLDQHGYPATTGEGQESKEEWPPRCDDHESAGYGHFTFGGCNGCEKTDFGWISLWEVVMVLKWLILDSFHFRRVLWTW